MSAGTDGVGVLLRALKLPGFLGHFQLVAEQAEREGWGFERYLPRLLPVGQDLPRAQK